MGTTEALPESGAVAGQRRVKWRRVADVGRSPDEVEKDLSGFALSGGGIRSATFALGVTQAFAAQDVPGSEAHSERGGAIKLPAEASRLG